MGQRVEGEGGAEGDMTASNSLNNEKELGYAFATEQVQRILGLFAKLPSGFLRQFYTSKRHRLALPAGAEQLLLSGQRASRTHHPPPLDIQRQVHVLFGPHWGDVAIKAAVKPCSVAGLHGTPVAGTALHQEPLLAQALHASITGHQLHPVEPV